MSGLLNQLKKKLSDLVAINQLPPVDVTKFNDSLAEKISWQPLKAGGANFATHILKQNETNKLEIKSSFGLKLFALVFLVIGCGALLFFFNILNSSKFSRENYIQLPFLVLFGLVFTGVAAAIYWELSRPTFFDRLKNQFMKGKRTYSINEIAAFQILQERIKTKNSNYISYELNIIFKSSERLNLIDHGQIDKIRDNAKEIVRFTNRAIPIWDATLPENWLKKAL